MVNWHNKYTLSQLRSLGDVCCPRCEKAWIVGPAFDHHIRRCNHCGAPVMEFNLISEVIVVDTDKAPKELLPILRLLDAMTEPDAYAAAKSLSELFRFL